MGKLEDALDILGQLELPRAQQNERSGLTLLALLDVREDTMWSQATAPLMGITPMMNFFADNYGKRYAPNSRETVRRQSVHQFLSAGLILQNPDKPDRPVNSGKTTYQISGPTLALLRNYGTERWGEQVEHYKHQIDSLAKRWAKERRVNRIPIVLPDGSEFSLSAGGQNVLIAAVIADFCQIYTPGGQVLYIGDADEKFAHFENAQLLSLGVKIEEHGKMPDLVIYDAERNWLVLVEAVTSHGPMNAKRHEELSTLFGSASTGLVFVTAFQDRRSMGKFLIDISWETEVWIADSPTHLIHFNGTRFLGPYGTGTDQSERVTKAPG